MLYEDLLLKNFNQELGLESRESRRWIRKFYKILRSRSPQYLLDIIPTKLRVHNTRYYDNILLLKIKHNYFRNHFFSLQQSLGLSYLNENKFQHSFNDTINPICNCEGNSESINHFFLHCPEYCKARQNLFDNIQSIAKMLLSQNESSSTHFFTVILNATPLLMHSFPTQQLNSNYLQEYSMDRDLTELKMFFFSFCN